MVRTNSLLHVEWQAGRNAVRVDLVGIQPLGLDEDLVRALVGEPDHLVLDRGTVARADALDDSGEHRRAVAGRADDLVRALVCLRDETMDLPRMLTDSPEERKHGRGLVARLRGHHREIDAAAVDARRRAGLQAPDAQRQLAQARSQALRRRIAGAAAGILIEPDMDAPAQECADGQHHRASLERDAGDGDDAGDAARPRRRDPPTSCWNRARLGWFSSIVRMARW